VKVAEKPKTVAAAGAPAKHAHAEAAGGKPAFKGKHLGKSAPSGGHAKGSGAAKKSSGRK
jgi:hypothetical protein